MNRAPTPFWKQPSGIFLLGFGGVLLLATLWLAFTRLGGSEPTAPVMTTTNRVDENALIAAHAERPGSTPAPAPAAVAADNVVEASVDAKPQAGEETAAVEPDPVEERFNPNEIIAEAQRALEDAEATVERVEEQVGKPEEGDGGK